MPAGRADVENGVILSSNALNVLSDPKDPRHFTLALTVQFGPEPDAPIMFQGQVVTHGDFVVDSAYPEDRAQKLAVVNGASILYGAAREMVANLTARGPRHPPLLLTSISFANMVEMPAGERPKLEPELKLGSA